MKDVNAQGWKSLEFISLGPVAKRGSFGQVWKAKKMTNFKNYAIKQVFVNSSLHYYGDNLEKLYREVDILEKLRGHRNVIKYYSSWAEGEAVQRRQIDVKRVPAPPSSTQSIQPETNFLFIQMELCHSSLHDWLAEHDQGQRVRETRRILSDTSAGLSYIHENRIVHRLY